jgi:tetratricopeptide (TPR) repeat protein
MAIQTITRRMAWQCAVLGSVLAIAAAALGGPLDDRLAAEAKNSSLQALDFVGAALIAGGVDDECELVGWRANYETARRDFVEKLAELPQAERLQALHKMLHDRILVGQYRREASDLRQVLARGDYNCLSSLVLYLDVCQAAGFSPEIRLRRGHVFLRVDGAPIEPGSRQWPEVERDAEGEESGERSLGQIELLGKFYYNRGIARLEERDFEAGLALLAQSLVLDPADADARANLAAGLNNWAVEHCREGRYDAAARLIEQGLALDASFGPLLANEQLIRSKRAK